MKKLTITIVALLIACLAVGSVAVGADRAKQIGTTLSVKYKEAKPSDPYGKSAFTGKVGPRKCAKHRKVTISGYGKEKTDRKGKFSLQISSPADPGKYRVKVAAKKSKKVDCTKVKTTIRVH